MGDPARGSRSNPVQSGARPRWNTPRGADGGVAGQASQRRPFRFQSRISPRDGLSRPVLRISTAAHQIPDYDGPRENARAILHRRLQRGDDPAKVAGLIPPHLRPPPPPQPPPPQPRPPLRPAKTLTHAKSASNSGSLDRSNWASYYPALLW